MAKMAVLIPYQNMLEQTEHMFNEFPHSAFYSRVCQE